MQNTITNDKHTLNMIKSSPKSDIKSNVTDFSCIGFKQIQLNNKDDTSYNYILLITSLNIQHLLPKMNEIRCYVSCNNAPYEFVKHFTCKNYTIC